MKLSRLKRIYDDLGLPVKASIWFMVCNVLLKGINVIAVPIFTRMMPDDQYGLLSVYMSYQAIIQTLSTWEISLSAYQKGLFKYKYTPPRQFTASTQLLSSLITTGFFVLILLAFRPFSAFSGLSLRSTVLLYVFMLLQPAYSCWLVENRTHYRYKSTVTVTLLYSLVNVAVPMLALVMIGRTAEVKFNASLLGSAAIFSAFYVRNIHYRKVLSDRDTLKEQWRFVVLYQLPIVLHALSYTVLAQSDRIMISWMVGDAQAAYYSVAYSIGSTISLFQEALSQTMVPWRFEKLEQKKYGDIRRTTDYLLMGSSIVALLFVFVAPEVMKLLFSSQYHEAMWSIPPVALGVFFMFVFTMFVWVENYYEKTLYVGVVSVICAIVNIVLNYSLIGAFGYIVCGYTTAASYALCSGLHYFAMKKVCRDCGVSEQIYNIRNIVLISLALTAATVGATLLYPFWQVRYAMVVLILSVLLVKRRAIMQVIRDYKT